MDPFRSPGPHPHTSWEQPGLFPPSVIRVEYVVWLDGPMGLIHWGWSISDGEELQLVAQEARPFRRLTEGTSPVLDDFASVLRTQRKRLSPF